MMIIRAGLVFGFTFHGIALFFGYRTVLETIPNLAWPELLLVGGELVGSNYCGSWGVILWKSSQCQGNRYRSEYL